MRCDQVRVGDLVKIHGIMRRVEAISVAAVSVVYNGDRSAKAVRFHTRDGLEKDLHPAAPIWTPLDDIEELPLLARIFTEAEDLRRFVMGQPIMGRNDRR